VRVCGTGATLHAPEGSSPPLPFVTVSDAQGANLIRLGLATRVADDVEAPVEAPKPTPKPAAAPKSKAAPAEAPPPPPAPAPAPAEETKVEEPKADDRAETILHAIDLVEPDGFETEGDRKGKPTVQAIQEITGLSDVTVEEIDAAVVAHGAA
jgi:outer membrane biosynthesis protein TonB